MYGYFCTRPLSVDQIQPIDILKSSSSTQYYFDIIYSLELPIFTHFLIYDKVLMSTVL